MREQRSVPIGLWVLALGVSGFAAGFFGPIILRPEANQGPMLGIFITGPGGAALGLLLGTLFRFLPISNESRRRYLVVFSALLAFGTLIFCLPPPENQAVLLEGTVAKCQAPSELTRDAIAAWEKRVANAPWANVRAGWQQEVPHMLRANTGVVLTIDVKRQNNIRKHRKPWNSGRMDAEGWNHQEFTRAYFADFAGDSCASYASLPMLQMRLGQYSNMWPPNELSNLLDLARVEPAPARYVHLAN
jgi:hypothetical protein